MPVHYEITHRTTYRYAEPVRFGEHRVLFRPRESHDLRVLATDLRVSPLASIRLIQDLHSNSVALVQPLYPATTLEIVATFTIEHAHTNNLELPVAPSAVQYPFQYSPDEQIDLAPYLRLHHPDPEGVLARWARGFVGTGPQAETRNVLVAMNQHIKKTFRYQVRHEEGTQAPLQTLAVGSGTCRDFALLMMEAARTLGIAARFVSGYLYDPALDGRAGPAAVGAGTTHAWLQAYLPGAGWVPFDPTNNLLGGTQLIRVGVARHPAQAAPVSGSWFGAPQAYLGMDVQVRISRKNDLQSTPASPAAASALPLTPQPPGALPVAG